KGCKPEATTDAAAFQINSRRACARQVPAPESTDGAEPYPQRAGEAGERKKKRQLNSIDVSRPAEGARPMRRTPASVSSIIPSLWQTKSKPASRTSRSIGEGAGTRDGAFDASLAGLVRLELDLRAECASS